MNKKYKMSVFKFQNTVFRVVKKQGITKHVILRIQKLLVKCS